jgi:hypothetical protein
MIASVLVILLGGVLPAAVVLFAVWNWCPAVAVLRRRYRRR